MPQRLLAAPPPGSRAQVPGPVAAPAPPAPEDRFDEVGDAETTLSWGARATLAGLGLVALAGPAFAGSGPVGAVASEAAPPALSWTVEPTSRADAPPTDFWNLGNRSGSEAIPDGRSGTGLRPGGGEGFRAVAAPEGLGLEGHAPPPPHEVDLALSTGSAAWSFMDAGKPARRIEGAQVNDSFRDSLNLFGDKYKRPNSTLEDDDGWTAEIRADVISTLGNEQSVTTGRLQMVTERGSWTPGPDYQARRTDIVEVLHQHNHRESLDGRTNVVWGAGLGVQAVGPMYGQDLQLFWHYNAPFGGRKGASEGLQTHYTSDHVSVAPMVTAGAGLQVQLDEAARWHFNPSVQGAVPLGPGMGNLRVGAALEYRPVERATLQAGAGVMASWTNGHSLDFIDAQGVRPTAWVGGEVRLTEHVSAFGRVDMGGIRNEPVYRVGLSISFGGGGERKAEKAWLDPAWR